MHAPNRNILWAKIFVDELARNGLKAVSLAPGSRNTPLVIAFAEHPNIRAYSHIDERSAAFFALGLALASDQPVAMVCSSGTATANFFPAVIEAHYSRVPLLVLTADRPPEVRESGANQTIDQVKLYGDHVLWAVDVALPEAQPAALTVRSLRTLAARAYATADGIPKGVVHLNFPFRKPLEPIEVESDLTDIADAREAGAPFTQIGFVQSRMLPEVEQIFPLVWKVRGAKRGIIYVGSRAGDSAFADEVVRIAEHLQFMVMADPLSNIRFLHESEWVIGGYDTFLQADKTIEPPDVVIQIGGMPTSQALDDWLNSETVQYRALISGDGVWTDPNHRLNTFIVANPRRTIRSIGMHFNEERTENLKSRDMDWLERLRAAERAAWDSVTEAQDGAYFDGMVVADVIDLLPENANVFIGNSLPVRHLDQFARPNGKKLSVYCNRGASGIDGTISSALGVAVAQPDRPLVLVLGDLAFYHDMNGLLAIQRCGVKATIVVINNDGGGIFYRLPIKNFEPTFTDLFRTPHGLEFSHAAALYGVDYVKTETRHDFREAFTAAIKAGSASIIEVPTNFEQDDQRRRAIIARAGELIKSNRTAENAKSAE